MNKIYKERPSTAPVKGQTPFLTCLSSVRVSTHVWIKGTHWT